MTDTRATQVVVEEWFSTNPTVQATIIVVEEWATVASGPPVYDASAQAIAMVLA